jgi:uncharacterized protein (DUF2141 family)
MMKKIFLQLILLFFVSACAIRVTPTGGDKDIEPPKVVQEFPSNKSTNFNGKLIEVTFDEYIQLVNIQKQVLISPLIEPAPEISVNKKKLIIKIPNDLRDNTTYSINFSKAIADIHEANPIPTYQYVFSTGPILDSLKVDVKVQDASNANLLSDITVMLYRNNDECTPDSTIFLNKPDYFGKTDESGVAVVNNVSDGKYAIIALRDLNGDFKCSNVSEEGIGFLDSCISVPSSIEYLLTLSTQFPGVLKLKRATRIDKVAANIVFNGDVKNIRFKNLDTGNDWDGIVKSTLSSDSIVLMTKDTLTDSLKLIAFDSKNAVIDTVLLQLSNPNLKSKINISKLKLTVISSPESAGPEASFVLTANRPLNRVNQEAILKLDSVEIDKKLWSLKMDLSNNFNLSIDHKWLEGRLYRLEIFPNAINDIYNLTNDTIRYSFVISSPEKSASMTVKVSKTDGKSKYLLQVLDEKSTILREIKFQNSGKYIFNYITPGAIKVRIVEDKNENGKWDACEYLAGVQPERITVSSAVLLRANWELESEIECPH